MQYLDVCWIGGRSTAPPRTKYIFRRAVTSGCDDSIAAEAQAKGVGAPMQFEVALAGLTRREAKEGSRTMTRKLVGVAFSIAVLAVGAAAQTGTVPLDSGTPPSGMTNSNITVSNGNVGIGTTVPSNKLDVIGGSIVIGPADFPGNASLHIIGAYGGNGRLTQLNTASGGALNIMSGNNGSNWWSWGVDSSANWNISPGTSFGSGGIVIAPSGNVGIGGNLSFPSFSMPAWGHSNWFGTGNCRGYWDNTYNVSDFTDNVVIGLNWDYVNHTYYSGAQGGNCGGPFGTAAVQLSAGYGPGNISFQVGGINTVPSTIETITTSGVGIGTTVPSAKLEVNGNLRLTAGSGASLTFADGTVQSTAYTGISCGGDYAESIDVTGDRVNYSPGDVIVIDSNAPGKFLKSAEPYSTSVTGVYSTKPGFVGRRQINPQDPAEVPMAMVGIVPTKVSAENGPIHPGDLLVTSSNSGYAMRGTDRARMLGAVIGKALGNLDSGTGVIEVVITLQ
jgi:hypothetical protein